MTDREALLYAVRANPACDTARLVFADWLQENGEEDRAVFIRRQCADPKGTATGAEWPRDGGKMPFDDWGDSANSILADASRRWRPSTWYGFRWNRGFVDHFALPVVPFWSFARQLFAAHPVEYMILSDVAPELHPGVTDDDLFEADRRVRPHILIGVDMNLDVLFGPRLPMHLWDLLDGFTEVDHEDELGMWPDKTYPTLAHAFEAVSRACVRWGRSLHDLPPYEPPCRVP